MENLLLSLRVVTPLVLMMGVGALLRATRLVTPDGFTQMTRVVFYVTLPALCYQNISKSDLSAVTSDPFLLLLETGIVLLCLVAALLVPLFTKDTRRRGVIAQAVYRSNDAIFGLAVASALLGADHLGLMSVAVALSVPLFNITAVILMCVYQGGKPNFWRLLWTVLKNPVVLGSLLGLAANLLHVALPEVLESTVSKLSAVTTPLAFIAIGGSLNFASARKNRVVISAVSALRLLIVPAAAVAAALALGYRGEAVAVTLVIFGAPVASGSYALACTMGGDSELAAELIAVTSALSVFTMFLFIFVLRELGVF